MSVLSIGEIVASAGVRVQALDAHARTSEKSDRRITQISLAVEACILKEFLERDSAAVRDTGAPRHR
jgi:hypothetical protein